MTTVTIDRTDPTQREMTAAQCILIILKHSTLTENH